MHSPPKQARPLVIAALLSVLLLGEQAHSQLLPPPPLVPAVPTSIGPGTSSSPGPILSSGSKTLSWNGSPGASYYRVTLSDAIGNGTLISATTTATSHIVVLSQGKKYKWTVAAGNGTGLSAPTLPLYFQTQGIPNVPGGLSPGSGIAPGPELYRSSVTLSWSPSYGAMSYRATLRDSGGAIVGGTTTSLTSCTVSVMAGKRYNWGVSASNYAGTSSQAGPFYFQVKMAAPFYEKFPSISLSGTAGSEHVHRIAVPSGVAKLVIATSGSSGNADLYVRYGEIPTTSTYTATSQNAGSNESVSLDNPTAGTWYVKVRAQSDYSGLSLSGSLVQPTSGLATPVISPGSQTTSNPVTVTMGCATAGAAIRYTTDGSTPDAGSILYTGSFAVSSSTQIKARAFKAEMADSATATANYFFNAGGITTLIPDVPVLALSGTIGSERLYKFTVPAGKPSLAVQMSGGTGNADIFIKRGTIPFTYSNDYAGILPGNNESVLLYNPPAGDYYIKIRAVSSYSGLNFVIGF